MSLVISSIMDRRPPVDPFRTHIESLELAGGMLDRYLQMDNLFPSFLDVTRISTENRIPTVSGHTDADYPTINDLPNLKQLSTVNKVPLPPEIMEHFGHLQCHCMMGLFTEISRAWLTIDSDIYVWTYEKGSDVAFFDGLGETIVNVGLVKPKPGVFNKFVKYLLILITTIEVVILGVTFSTAKDMEEIHLIPGPMFVIPTDNITFNTTACTESGRIFLGGKDGNLYEIVYQAESVWFGKRCKKVNHSQGTLSFLLPSFLSFPFRKEGSIVQIAIDESRYILYTLNENGIIEVYDLGENGTSMSRVASISESSIVQTAAQNVKFLDAKIFSPIVQLCAVEANDSPYVNFIVVTKSGVRLYFSTSYLMSVSQRPNTAQLIHIRLPPGYTASTLANRPSNVHKAYYRNGSLILVANPRGEKGDKMERDNFWCLSTDLYPFRPYLAEMRTVLPLDGGVWAMEETKLNTAGAILPFMRFSDTTMSLPAGMHGSTVQVPLSDPPLIVRQHMEPPRKYVILTSQGVEIVIKLRPVDMLRQLLVENRGPEGKTIKRFFKEQKEDQACATCLILACLYSVQNTQVAEWATQAFFIYGSEPISKSPEQPQPTQTPSFRGPAMGVSSPLQYSMRGAFNPRNVSIPNPFHRTQQQAMRLTNRQVFSPGQAGTSFTSPSQQPFARSMSQQQFGSPITQQSSQQFLSPKPQKHLLGSLKLPQPQSESPVFQQSAMDSSILQQSQMESSMHQPQESGLYQQQFGSPLPQQPQQQFGTPLNSQQQGFTTSLSRQPQFGTSMPQHQFPSQLPQQKTLSPMDQSMMQSQQVPSKPPMNYMAMSTGYTAKHNGLYLHLSRILSPIWKVRTVQCTLVEKKGPFLLSVISRKDCVFILGHLHALRTFLDKNPQYSTIITQSANTTMSRRLTRDGYEPLSQPHSRSSLVNTQQKEKRSLDALKVLVSHICEVMGLWKILCEHQFHMVAGALSENYRTELLSYTFRNLILSGHELCSVLINCLINSYLNDNASVDAISAKLREICPHLYRNEDAACSKANEMLLSARKIQNQAEKEAKLQAALQLYKSVAPQVNLPLICQWFSTSQYYEGILELCTTCALKLDPKNMAQHYYKNRQLPGDEEGYRAYVERMQCYKEVTSILDHLYGQSMMSSSYNTCIPGSLGRKGPMETSQIVPRKLEQQARKLIEGALMSTDELLHIAIYEWMLNKELLGELVFVLQPSFETFIKRKAENSANVTYMFDLLWKYYEKNENHAGAAKVLLKLATMTDNKISLSQRVAYLARAVICMRSDKVGCAPQLGVFLRELEDKIEVARLQQQILDALNLRQQTEQVKEAINKLNSGLLDITELYENYAEPFSLWDCKLAIIHCSGHLDQMLIEHVWLNIVDTELRSSSSVGGNSKIAVVMSKVKDLGQEYSISPRCFPVLFLVKQLELHCCRIGADCVQVFPTMISLGLSVPRLIQVYDTLISEGDMCWFKSGREFHLHQVVGHLIDNFVKNPKMVPSPERHLIATKAEDLLTKCLIFLYSKSNAGELIEMLQGVKSRVNRLSKEL